MSFAAPLFAWVGLGAAVVTIGLHLLAWKRPQPTPLPTARFVPETPARLLSRAIRPADLLLLALRTLLVSLVGLALAGPSFSARPRGAARVIVVDRSAAAPDRAITDTARSLFRPGDALIVFDSLAREVVPAVLDSIVPVAWKGVGSLSAGLVVAVRAAERLRHAHDSVTVVIVSPFARDELDAATAPIRRTWPGPLRLVRAGRPPNDDGADGPVAVRAPAGDPVAAAYALAGAVPGGAGVRIVRDSLTAADSAWAAAGRLVVVWPREPGAGWSRSSAPDTAFAVTVPAASAFADGAMQSSATVVAPFVRAIAPPPGRVVARWSDGAPAATERTMGAGCVRAVIVPVPDVGDLALTPAFGRVASRLAAPCDGRELTPASDSLLAAILPSSLDGASPRADEGAMHAGSPATRLPVWLLAFAMFAAVAELFLRRRGANAVA